MEFWAGLAANGLLFTGGWLVAAHGLRLDRRLDRWLGGAVVALSGCLIGLQLLGSLGVLNAWALLGWSAGFFLAGLAVRARWGRHKPSVDSVDQAQGLTVVETWRWETILAAGLVVWVFAILGMQSLLLPVKVVSDGPIYHLYFAARWWKAERLFLVAAPFGENAATYFPANGDLWFTWLMTTWNGDRLAKVGQFPFLVLAMAASFAIGRMLGAGRNAAMIAVCWFATSSPLLLFSFEPNVDTIFVAGYLLGIYFFLRYLVDGASWSALLLGGLATGITLGSKAVGVVFVPPLLIIVFLVLAWTTKPVTRSLPLCLLILLGVAATSAFWYGRNFLLTGNPLYPLHLEIAGRTILQGWYGPEAMKTSQYYIPFHEWRALVDTLLAVGDPRMVPLWVAAIGGVWAIGSRRHDRNDRWIWTLTGLAIFNVALYWICIPYRTQQRFMLQALGLAAVPLARLFDRSRVLAILASLLLGLHLLMPQSWPVTLSEAKMPWDQTPIIPNVVPAALQAFRIVNRENVPVLEPVPIAKLAILLGAGVCSIVAVAACTRGLDRPRGKTSALLLAASVCGLLGLAALDTGILGTDRRLLLYPPFRDFFLGWQNLEARSGAGARVAYAGTNIPYYLLGSGLRNDVRYVNIDEHRAWLLHDYHRRAIERGEPTWPNSRPGWDREAPNYDAWLANLRAERIQLLVVTRVNPAEGAHNVADAELFPIERVWAEGHPQDFEPLYGVREGDPFFRIYRLRRPD